MPIRLDKGDTFDLHTNSPALKSAGIGLGWDVKSAKAGILSSFFGGTPAEYDLDVSAFVLGPNGKLISDSYFVFFNNKSAPDRAVVHSGDNRTGEGEGDDETIFVDFDRLPKDAQTVTIWVTLYKAAERKQSLGEVENAYVRLYDQAGNTELLKFELAKLQKSETALEFCKLTRSGAGWIFHAVGEGHPLEIGGVLARFT